VHNLPPLHDPLLEAIHVIKDIMFKQNSLVSAVGLPLGAGPPSLVNNLSFIPLALGADLLLVPLSDKGQLLDPGGPNDVVEAA